jgi:hypothetical protein
MLLQEGGRGRKRGERKKARGRERRERGERTHTYTHRGGERDGGEDVRGRERNRGVNQQRDGGIERGRNGEKHAQGPGVQ